MVARTTPNGAVHVSVMKIAFSPATLLHLYLLLAPPLWRSKTVTLVVSAPAAHTAPSWNLVWSDEFDQPALDTKKWTVLEGDGCNSELGCGWKRGQIDVSSPKNAYIGEGGHLVIVANRHTADTKMLNASSPSGHDSFAAGPPTSARLSTIGSADFVHGQVQVRAKVAPGGWGGWSGIWLLPSEERGLGRASCARVNVVEMSKSATNEATASLEFGHENFRCESSDFWPRPGGGCAFSGEQKGALSDDFHVYSVEWEDDEFRWYLDGSQYCTKTRWFTGNATVGYPAPFNKTFHLEVGLAVGGRPASWDSQEEEDDEYDPLSALPQEMLVDYVRISQGPSGLWRTPPESVSTAAADEEMWSSTLLDFLIDALACVACVLGPYMAMTGLSRPQANTILMGVVIGAFKAANASYLIYGSYEVTLATAVVFGLLAGYLSVRHTPLARWNTVAGLAVPALFLLIDVGMISDIGSRFVCWAIFFILTVTFAVLAFPREHHAMAFGVSAAATGSCVLKVALGHLLGAPGEVFKILDDPLGDRCHISRTCHVLNWVSAAVFIVGLWSQCCLAPRFLEKTPSSRIHRNGRHKDGVAALFTPPRSGFSRSRTASDKSAESDEEDEFWPGGWAHESASGPRGAGGRYENGLSPTRTSGMWKRASTRARRFLDTIRHPFSSRGRPIPGVDSLADSPTPVPMPPTGRCANTVVSNQGDIIELVVHSPIKVAQGRSLPWGFGGSDNTVSEDGPGLSSLTGGRRGGDRRGDGQEEALRRRATTPDPSFVDLDTSADDDDDVYSLVAPSAVSSVEPSAPTGPPSSLRLTAALLEDRNSGAVSGGGVGIGNGGETNGRLADAFNERWGAWAGDFSDDQGLPLSLGGGSTADGRRARRDFDREALLLNPYDHQAFTSPPVAVEGEATAPRSRSSSSSTTQTGHEDDWMLTTDDGHTSPRYGTVASAASTAAAWTDHAAPSTDSDTAGRAPPDRSPSKRNSSSSSRAAGTIPPAKSEHKARRTGTGVLAAADPTRSPSKARSKRHHASSNPSGASLASSPRPRSSRPLRRKKTDTKVAACDDKYPEGQRGALIDDDNNPDDAGGGDSRTTDSSPKTEEFCSPSNTRGSKLMDTEGYQEERGSISPKPHSWKRAAARERGGGDGARGDERATGRVAERGPETAKFSEDDEEEAASGWRWSTADESTTRALKEIDL